VRGSLQVFPVRSVIFALRLVVCLGALRFEKEVSDLCSCACVKLRHWEDKSNDQNVIKERGIVAEMCVFKLLL